MLLLLLCIVAMDLLLLLPRVERCINCSMTLLLLILENVALLLLLHAECSVGSLILFGAFISWCSPASKDCDDDDVDDDGDDLETVLLAVFVAVFLLLLLVVSRNMIAAVVNVAAAAAAAFSVLSLALFKAL
jgi:hypothetical protein